MNKKALGIIVCIFLAVIIILTIFFMNSTPPLKMIWTETQKLTTIDGETRNWVGSSVSISGNTALIGAWGDKNSTGSAYVYTLTGPTWVQQAKLTATDGVEHNCFGSSVSISGDTAIIGAWNDNYQTGAAYIFTRSGTTWTQQAKLTATDGKPNENFGFSVSLSGDTALIGARYGDGNKAHSGSAYIFIKSSSESWIQQDKLTASDGNSYDYFGNSISLSGDTAIVGADGDENFTGAVYVFTRTGSSWTQQAKLTASDGSRGNEFGYSVSLSDDTVLIGAIAANNSAGAVYVFTHSGTTWTQQKKLTVKDGTTGDYFGNSVSLSDNIALIGAYLDDVNQSNAGSVYIFTRTGTTWTQQTKFIASDGAMEDHFGESVSLSRDGTALIGAPYSDDKGIDSGSAYIFAQNST